MAARADIAVALKRRLRVRLRSRLQAIDAVLAGKPLENAAALIYVKPSTLKLWLGQILKHGMPSMLAKGKVAQTRHPKLEADSAVLRARAARQRDRGKRNRLIALALIAEGLSLNDAEVQSGISSGTIRNCLRRYEDGIAAVCSMSATHRKSRPLAQSRQL